MQTGEICPPKFKSLTPDIGAHFFLDLFQNLSSAIFYSGRLCPSIVRW
jgi:hypothetical protein